MNARTFVDEISGGTFAFTRTCLARWMAEKTLTVVPDAPGHNRHGSSIRLGASIHCYDDNDLFTNDDGIYVAVVKTGAGHLFCDRFVPIKESESLQEELA